MTELNSRVLFIETKDISGDTRDTFLLTLGIPLNIIHQYENTYSRSPERVLVECLDYWFRASESERTWEEVFLALKKSGNSDRVHKIKEKYFKEGDVQADDETSYVAFGSHDVLQVEKYERRPSILINDTHAEIEEKYSKASEQVAKFHIRVKQKLKSEKLFVKQKAEEFETDSNLKIEELNEQSMHLISEVEKYEEDLKKGLEYIENKDYSLPSTVRVKSKVLSSVERKYQDLHASLQNFEHEIPTSDSLYSADAVAEELKNMLKLKVATETSVCDDDEYGSVDQLLYSNK